MAELFIITFKHIIDDKQLQQIGGYKMKFHKYEFLEYMEDTSILSRFSRWLLDSLVDYAEKNCNVTKNQMVYFIYDILKEVVPIDYEEIEQFYRKEQE